MRILSILLTIAAVFLSILIIALTIVAISIGGGSILLPGLGLVISLPALLIMLLICDAVIIFFALLTGKLSRTKTNLK